MRNFEVRASIFSKMASFLAKQMCVANLTNPNTRVAPRFRLGRRYEDGGVTRVFGFVRLPTHICFAKNDAILEKMDARTSKFRKFSQANTELNNFFKKNVDAFIGFFRPKSLGINAQIVNPSFLQLAHWKLRFLLCVL